MSEQVEAGSITFDSADLRRSIEDALKALNSLEQGTKRVADSVDKQANAFESLGRKMQGWIGAAVLVGAFTRAVGDVTQAILGAEAADHKLNAMLKATGEQAGITGDAVEELAHKISRTSLFDDEKVKEASARALMFSSITETNFKRVMQAATDLSAVMDRDLTGSVMQLGRALENPTQGMNLLRRAGIVFTQQEQEQIRSAMRHNDVLGAQEVILKKVESRMSGVAAEMNQGLTGATTTLAKEWENLLELFKDSDIVKKTVIPNIQGLSLALQHANDLASNNVRIRARAELADLGLQLDEQTRILARKYGDEAMPANRPGKGKERDFERRWWDKIEETRAAIRAREDLLRQLDFLENRKKGSDKDDEVPGFSQETQKELDEMGRAYTAQLKQIQLSPAAFERWKIAQAALNDETHYTVEQLNNLSTQVQSALYDAGAYERRLAGIATLTERVNREFGIMAEQMGAGSPVKTAAEILAELMAKINQGVVDSANSAAISTNRIFDMYAEGVAEFRSLTEDTLSGAISSWENFASRIVQILQGLAAELAANYIFDQIATATGWSLFGNVSTGGGGGGGGDVPTRLAAGGGRRSMGGGGQVVQLMMPISVQALDGATAVEVLQRNAPVIQGIVMRGIQTSGVMRRQMGGA